MSLTEAYRLAHTAECRLQLAASRPDRNLRFVVGHLMHYESLRLRIVEIEHETSRSRCAKAGQFPGASALRHKASTGQLGRESLPAPIPGVDEDDENDLSDQAEEDDEDDEDLGLMRFPSGSARPPPLEPDVNDEVKEDDEPVSPEEPDQATLEQLVKGDGSELLTRMYEGVRKCGCHGQKAAPSFERMWELPSEPGKEDVTRAVAEIREGEIAPLQLCTEPS